MSCGVFLLGSKGFACFHCETYQTIASIIATYSTVLFMQIISSSNKMTSILAISSVLLLASSAGATPQQNSNYRRDIQKNTVCSFITGNKVNIRSGAGNNYKVITKLNRGDGVRATYQKGNWVQITATSSGIAPNETFKPLKGWVYNAYINGCSEDQFDRWRS